MDFWRDMGLTWGLGVLYQEQYVKFGCVPLLWDIRTMACMGGVRRLCRRFLVD